MSKTKTKTRAEQIAAMNDQCRMALGSGGPPRLPPLGGSAAGKHQPRVISVDGHPAYPAAIDQLKQAGQLGQNCRCRRAPYLNNVVEQTIAL